MEGSGYHFKCCHLSFESKGGRVCSGNAFVAVKSASILQQPTHNTCHVLAPNIQDCLA